MIALASVDCLSMTAVFPDIHDLCGSSQWQFSLRFDYTF